MPDLTLAEVPPRHDNHFNLIRFLAAAAVLYSHGFDAVAGQDSVDGLAQFTGVSGGELAVNIFFGLSGFLVAGSLLNRGTLKAFISARALRIYPALCLSVIVSALLVGPIFTSVPWPEYFRDKMTWGFITRNCLSINPDWFRWELPGVFVGLPSSGIVNAPLWTLPWEICMYISLALLFPLRLLRPSSALLIWLGAAAVYLVASHTPGFHKVAVQGWRFVAFFYGGVALYYFRAKIPRTGLVPILALAALIIAACFKGLWYLMPFLLPYVTVCLGYANAPALLPFNKIGDGSYGLYIYAYPVQQALVLMFGITPAWINAAITLVLVYPIALASWHLLEKRMLELKRLFH